MLSISIQNIDYSATFLDMAGIPVPKEIHGLSMKNILLDKDATWRDAIYYHYYEFPNEHMVKKLIHFYDDIDVWEMYDLEKDPNEMNNLISQKEYQETIEKLKIRLAELQEEYQDSSMKIDKNENSK